MGYKLKKILLRTGIIFVTFIAVLFIIRAVFNVSTGKKLENHLEQMRAEEKPLSIKDIETQCDPRYNAALDWKKAEASFSIEKEQRELLGKVIEELFQGRPLDPKTKETIRDLAVKNREAINFMLEASSKSCVKYREHWDVVGYDPYLPMLIKMIQGTRLLGVDAVLKAEDGDVDEAVNQCLAAVKFFKLYLQEPFLINYLVDLACTKQVAVCLNTIISDSDINTETLKNILSEWNSSPWKEGLVFAFESEKLLQCESILLYLEGEHKLDLGKGENIYYWLFRPVLKNEIICLMKTWDKLIESAEKPYYISRNSKDIKNVFEETPRFYKMTRALFPNIGAVLLKKATLDAMFETARIGMACKIFKNLNGEYPETLDELSPEILKTIPVDPFTGNPYVYRKENSGFIVYSVGSNQKDEDGRGTLQITQMVMEKDDDWTWREK
ncbi:MAG: hypothetical protein JXB26_08430 [Candidatus Aminicenantes bacterium]|nr:hypothetical protein [Candidatus Aminicenantes bacterium]